MIFNCLQNNKNRNIAPACYPLAIPFRPARWTKKIPLHLNVMAYLLTEMKLDFFKILKMKFCKYYQRRNEIIEKNGISLKTKTLENSKVLCFFCF
ncbi:hypothetical protein MB09_03640 [Aequorivita vladivostokensis]|uniref:Uncharacterized protein n=1 Tax=Aequorivita vladivostokensis TaxID=171194 RepID=A0ABR5DKP3_9FLAO|nr:hypothetical protein MB09_03640 [Aequorivita vladivostokensis]